MIRGLISERNLHSFEKDDDKIGEKTIYDPHRFGEIFEKSFTKIKSYTEANTII